MADFTEEERVTLRGAAVGAMVLVSHADPGLFAVFKESMAGARALTEAPPQLREVFRGRMPPVPEGSPAELESGILGQLQQAVTILRAKAPDQLEGYRSVIVEACEAVAAASGGVKQAETVAIEKVKRVIGAAGA